jgi:hypothetical protein
VCAPGESITAASSASDTGWYTGDGTSASAPLVGGLVACMLQANPSLTPAQVKQILHETSEHNTALSTKYLLTPNNGYGWGVVDAVGAVLRAKDLRAPAMTLPATFTAGNDVPVEVKGTYTRTQHTNRGQDGRSPLGEDDIELTATVPGDWGRPTKTTYTMDGPIKGAVAVPDAVTQSGGAWKLHVTFRVRTSVSAPTTGFPTMKFSSTTPTSVDGKTYNLTAREALNTMQGALLTEYVSVGGNVPPTISIIDPGAGTQYADASYTIRWTDEDPDSSAQITLAYDTDTDPGTGLVQIATGIPEDPDGVGDTYAWNTSSLPDGGVYYVRATIDDGINPPVSTYSAGPVTIKHTGNVPPTITIIKPGASGDTADSTYLIEYVCYDPDDVATIDLYWDTDNAGFDGVLIVSGLTESDGTGDYTWDTGGQPDGAVRWVYAIASDSANPPARTYSQGPVTITHPSGPKVVDHSPDGTGVAVDEPARVTFDSEMDRGSVEAAFSVAPYRPGAFSWVGNTVRYDPQSGWAARTMYTVTVSTSARDSGGRPLAQAFSFTFTTGDAPPGPTSPSVTIISPREGDVVSGEVWVEGSAHDLGAGGVVDVRIDAGPWQQASGNEVWTYKWDSTQSPDGGHTAYARGTDAKGGTAPIATVNVTSENAANRPPVIRPVPDQKVVAGELLEVQIEATDPDSDALRYSDSTPLFEIDPTTGLIAFRPYDGQVGTWHVTVSVTDGKATSYVTFNITVLAKQGAGLLSWPSWLGPLQLSILAAAAIVGVAAAVATRRSAMARRRRAAAHKIKVASKGKHAKGEAT